jgi:iron complex transport system substrate-binding protein
MSGINEQKGKKMKLLRFCTAILVICMAGLAACAKTSSPTATTYTDDLGRTVTIQATPHRIVSLSPSNTEILFALGEGAEVVGTDDYSDYPAEAKNITHVGSDYPSFSIETIISLKPDLAIAFGYTLPDYVTQLQNLGIPVIVLAPKDVGGVISDITMVGKITGAAPAAKTLTTGMQNSLNTVESKIKDVTAPRVLWEFDGTDPGNPWIAGPGSFNDALITLAGGQDVGARGPASSWQMSTEDIVKADPQIIILDDYQFGVTVQSAAQRPGWSTITAVKDGAIYPITDSNLTDRPGPRVIQGLQLLANIIHPELFK